MMLMMEKERKYCHPLTLQIPRTKYKMMPVKYPMSLNIVNLNEAQFYYINQQFTASKNKLFWAFFVDLIKFCLSV